ncbi:MAG TPA: translation initiation factor IF-3 [Rhodospirillaceae bacterium]|jgi:translation initiation factor IF-3|nr:translation initiation factor IF-3 [Alphaproteobacteria bacterium]HBH26822.1 translation initiation factor IF-3 [Rhodospirillaceae bacterium]
MPSRPSLGGPRVGAHILRGTPQVRLIDKDGTQRVVPTSEALRLAEEVGLDLVEVSAQSDPPVCKLLDYGRYKYEQKKKAAEARKKQRTADVKEIKLRPGIEKHDYDVKLRNARRFLGGGDKVKISLRFRGREVTHSDLGRAVVERLIADLADLGKVEQAPKMEGRQIIALLVPDTTKGA